MLRPVSRRAVILALALVAVAVLATSTGAAASRGPAAFALWRTTNWAALAGRTDLVRTVTVHYRAHDGAARAAVVVLPRWYGPHNHPPIPLVISPHGSGIQPAENARRWGNLPALGSFAVINPEGQGARLALYSWGSPGEIADLARMPSILRETVPWLRIDRRRIYAVGGSMGGQESLLLLAKHPHLLAGVVSFDAPTNMATRYAAFPLLKGGRALQELARLEFGSIPRVNGEAWADRSPLFYSRELAFSHVPLQIWWSRRDQIVVHQADQSGLLFRAIERLNPHAPVLQFVGRWRHTAEMRPTRGLPLALARIGLLRLGPAEV
jgi:pimeloyl-ACP methyl ester carboxylesterase